jgi:hypothetical protein
MKVYIVFTERGTIYSIRKSKTDANKDKAQLEKIYETATIKEFNVR